MSKLGAFFRDSVTPIILLILGGVVAYDHLMLREPSTVATVVNGKTLGRKFAATVASSLGDAWSSAADILEQGKPMADAQSAMQARWQDGRAKAFSAQVAPEFSKVLSEGAEPTDPSKRAEVVKLWRDFATGLKGGR